ncbi:MAG: tetratricopeptide repeat protein [Bacteroidota bacterium]
MSASRIEMLLAFYDEDPTDTFTQFALAQEYRKAGQPEQAVAFFEGLVRNHPAYVGTYYHLAEVYRDQGRTDDAIAVLNHGVQEGQRQRDFKAVSEMRDLLMQLQGIGFDDDDE